MSGRVLREAAETIRADQDVEESLLSTARREAVDAAIKADEAESDARRIRRQATSKMKAYERLLLAAQEAS